MLCKYADCDKPPTGICSQGFFIKTMMIGDDNLVLGSCDKFSKNKNADCTDCNKKFICIQT
jgi:hypothetical protein